MATGTSETSGRDEGGEVEHPDLGKLEEALRDKGEIRSVGITLLLVLAVFYTLYFARSFFLPVVLAVLLDFLLSPIIRVLKRWRVPESLGAAIVVAGLLGLVGAGAYSLTDPARAWVAKAPESLQKIQSRLQKLRKPVEQVSRTAEQVEEATKLGPSGVQEVVLRGPTIRERIFGSTQELLTGALEMVVLLYFLLAVGDLFLEKLIKVLPPLGDKKKAVTIVRETEASISTYLFTVTLVNLGLGLVVALVMHFVGMPNPLLWGALAGLAEFVPYLGATVMLITLSLAGLVTFPSWVTQCWSLAHISPSIWCRPILSPQPSSGADSRSIRWPSCWDWCSGGGSGVWAARSSLCRSSRPSRSSATISKPWRRSESFWVSPIGEFLGE